MCNLMKCLKNEIGFNDISVLRIHSWLLSIKVLPPQVCIYLCCRMKYTRIPDNSAAMLWIIDLLLLLLLRSLAAHPWFACFGLNLFTLRVFLELSLIPSAATLHIWYSVVELRIVSWEREGRGLNSLGFSSGFGYTLSVLIEKYTRVT